MSLDINLSFGRENGRITRNLATCVTVADYDGRRIVALAELLLHLRYESSCLMEAAASLCNVMEVFPPKLAIVTKYIYSERG